MFEHLEALVRQGEFPFTLPNGRQAPASMSMGPPTTVAEIAACEAAIGSPLPRSFRQFLLTWNGASLYEVSENGRPVYETVRILGATELAWRNLHLRDSLAAADRRPAVLFAASGNFWHCFDLIGSESDPYVVGGDALWLPEDWLRWRLADSFVDWMERLLASGGHEWWMSGYSHYLAMYEEAAQVRRQREREEYERRQS